MSRIKSHIYSDGVFYRTFLLFTSHRSCSWIDIVQFISQNLQYTQCPSPCVSECFSLYLTNSGGHTENRWSSVSTLLSKKSGDTQVWMTLCPPLPHLHPLSFLHNTQTPFLSPLFDVENPSTFPVNLKDFFGLIPCAAWLRYEVTPCTVSHAAKYFLDLRNRSWVWFQL